MAWKEKEGKGHVQEGLEVLLVNAVVLLIVQANIAKTIVPCFPRSGKMVQSLHPPMRSAWNQHMVRLEKGENITICDNMEDITFNYMNLYENLSGKWKKVPELCTSMQRAYELSNLPWVIQKAIKFLKHLEVRNGQEHAITL